MPLPVDTPPRLISCLKVARDHFVDATWNRAKMDLCSDEGLVRGPAVSDGHGMGRACRLMGLQPILGSWPGASQVDTRRCLRR